MKICFLARSSFDRFSVALYTTMKKDFDSSLSAVFVTSNSSESKYVKSMINDAEIRETSSFIRTNCGSYSVERLAEYERKYVCSPIWKYIYSDRFLVNRDYDYAVKITCGLFDFYGSIFKDGSVDFYYSESIATLQCYVGYIVGKFYGVKYVSQMCARGSLDSTYHYFVYDEFQHNAKFDVNYKNIQYTDEEWIRADKYLKEFEEKDCPPPSAQTVASLPHISRKFITGPIKRVLKRFDKEFNDPYSYMYYEGYKRFTDPIKFWYQYNKVKKYYKNADYSKKYVYYPLHYQPEASTLVCAEKYEKQIFFIDSLAKSLPADTLLYVKEHYALLGHRDPSFYTEMKKYPNVVVINPLESSRKLIEKSYAVATLTGTAGLEAVLLRKPVVMGGQIVFDNAPGVIRTDDIYDKFVDSMTEWKQPARDEIIKYLCACFRSYSLGNAYAQNIYEYIDDNIDDLSKSLYDYCAKEISRI